MFSDPSHFLVEVKELKEHATLSVRPYENIDSWRKTKIDVAKRLLLYHYHMESMASLYSIIIC